MSIPVSPRTDAFLERVTDAARRAMNTPEGLSMTRELLRNSLRKNPGLTHEEWHDIRSRFLTLVVLDFIQNTPKAIHDLADAVYHDLREEGQP